MKANAVEVNQLNNIPFTIWYRELLFTYLKKTSFVLRLISQFSCNTSVQLKIIISLFSLLSLNSLHLILLRAALLCITSIFTFKLIITLLIFYQNNFLFLSVTVTIILTWSLVYQKGPELNNISFYNMISWMIIYLLKEMSSFVLRLVSQFSCNTSLLFEMKTFYFSIFSTLTEFSPLFLHSSYVYY